MIAHGTNKCRDDQDLEFVVTAPTMNDSPIDLTNTDWNLSLIGSEAQVLLERRGSKIVSKGTIPATVSVSEGTFTIYAKSSETPFGKGTVSVEMTIFFSNPSFPGGIQVVKTDRATTNVILI